LPGSCRVQQAAGGGKKKDQACLTSISTQAAARCITHSSNEPGRMAGGWVQLLPGTCLLSTPDNRKAVAETVSFLYQDRTGRFKPAPGQHP
jgi:hypothetical protein